MNIDPTKSSVKRIVHTCKNTDLKHWTVLVKEDAARRSVDISTVRELSMKHAWELGYTPVSYVDELSRHHNRPKNVIVDRSGRVGNQ